MKREWYGQKLKRNYSSPPIMKGWYREWTPGAPIRTRMSPLTFIAAGILRTHRTMAEVMKAERAKPSWRERQRLERKSWRKGDA